jgi:hypothetical protein
MEITGSKMSGWLEVAGSVALAIAAEPIHEAGHAVAARCVTGVWPTIGFWAVHPTAPFRSTADMLAVLSAGDLAVLAWWGLMLLIAHRRPERKWILVGPSLVLGLAVMNWFAASILSPFGYGHLGASDAAKFMALSGLAPWTVASVMTGILALMGTSLARVFRSGTQPLPAV